MSETKAVKGIKSFTVVSATGDSTVIEMPKDVYDAWMTQIAAGVLDELEREVEARKAHWLNVNLKSDESGMNEHFSAGCYDEDKQILSIIRSKKGVKQ